MSLLKFQGLEVGLGIVVGDKIHLSVESGTGVDTNTWTDM